ncbi:hypothetical protein HN832_02105 [archaeon]|jgi:hypothetical protein|nr:hypothetical protein [archaeon]MBT4373147.1 hypothetical protein [archaeon]MBT4531492.1 hypothetical protein [archaeon]MBT7001330.1 hypothetical protein [archaeon]MBT7282184.1 hypothetical protein [archaeon]
MNAEVGRVYDTSVDYYYIGFMGRVERNPELRKFFFGNAPKEGQLVLTRSNLVGDDVFSFDIYKGEVSEIDKEGLFLPGTNRTAQPVFTKKCRGYRDLQKIWEGLRK